MAKSFGTYQNRIPDIIGNSSGSNVAWANEMINDSIRYLVTKYYFNERTYTVPNGTIAQQQFYNLPPQVKKVINVTVTIGGVKWQPVETPTRQTWDRLNVINFYQDYPSNFFIFNGQLGLFPIPATTGNTITINYKTRIQDLSMADVTDITSGATVSANNGSATITATSSAFKQWMGTSGWIRIPHSTTDSQNGDNQWYQISSVTSGTQILLANNYSGANASGASFAVGDFAILPEDYEDLPLYRMGYIYYSTRVYNQTQADRYEKLWNDGVTALDEEFGSKTTSVALPDTEAPLVNPNLFARNVQQN